jgi:DNA-binding protein H-NS
MWPILGIVPVAYPSYTPQEQTGVSRVATINGLDKMSYADLLKVQEHIGAAISVKRVEDVAATKKALRAMAEKAGFNLNELFGTRGPKKGSGEAKYRNPKDISQTWTGRGRKPNWLVDLLKKGSKMETFSV